ncbi:MAG: hypothetical protein V3U78_01660, partial [Thiotrichaceae bacterium]
MLIKSINGLFFSIFILTLTACGGESGSGSTNTTPTTSTVSGNIQKGPFVSISLMTAERLNDDGSESGETKDLTANGFNGNGSYQQFNLPWVGWTRLTVTGRYFNEYTGLNSTTEATLSSTQNLTGTDDVINLNLFTTLANELLKKKLPFGAGETLASVQQNVVDALKLSLGLSSNSVLSSLDLTQKGSNADNAILLLFSGAFLKSGDDLGILVADFEDNAIFDSIE